MSRFVLLIMTIAAALLTASCDKLNSAPWSAKQSASSPVASAPDPAASR